MTEELQAIINDLEMRLMDANRKNINLSKQIEKQTRSKNETRAYYKGQNDLLKQQLAAMTRSRDGYIKQLKDEVRKKRNGKEILEGMLRESKLAAQEEALGEGWVIIHPERPYDPNDASKGVFASYIETDYFKSVIFTRNCKATGWEYKACTPEEWRQTYRPDCEMVRAKLIEIK